MSDNQRRTYCRILFLLLCALPTAFVTYKICHPQTAQGWQQTLQAELGIPTSIDSIETPGPYVTILRGLEFSDPEYGTLMKAVEARILFDDVNTVHIPYRVHGMTNRGLSQLVKYFNKNLVRTRGMDKRWRIIFDEDLAIEEYFGSQEYAEDKTTPPESIVLRGLQIDVVPKVDGTLAELNCSIAGQDELEKRVSCQMSRTDQFGNWLVLDTNEHKLPCWLVANDTPEVIGTLGFSSTFQGRVEVSPTLGRERHFINGRFAQVDLEKSIPIADPEFRFAEIELDNCEFENGKPINWLARMFQPPFATPSQIKQEDLMTFSQRISVAQAIKETLNRRPTHVGAISNEAFNR